ncbi:MAG TPA: carboxypeptidase-like regulatory domain-containing protein [Bryobacteraceae bacterium]|nr:carboxypeptidase-like regulatory domain-containing protein [Bryobacteraceae bacterium]
MKSVLIILAAAAISASGQFVLNGVNIPQPVHFDCAIDGSVVNALTGEPIARAHVGLQSGTAVSTSTDASGKWSLSNAACTPSLLVATRPGFLQQNKNAGSLVSGSPVHEVKIELMPQAVLYGKVVDDQGDPVNSVQLHLLAARVLDGRFRFQQEASASTNDLGEYRVAGLRKGRYFLCASTMNGIQAVSLAATTCYPGPVDGGNAGAMEITAGHEMKVDFTLNQVARVHVRGTVTGLPDGRGVGISLAPRASGAAIGGNASSPLREGRFDFAVASGAYTLMADYFESGKHLFARVPVDVGSSDIDNVTVAMDTGFTVTGTVRIQTQSQQPARKLQFGVTLRPSDSTVAPGQVKWDTNGSSFSFADLMPGAFRLEAFPPAPYYVKSATLSGQDILSSELTVSGGAGPIEIVLGDDGGSIEGDVVNADGQQVSGGVIALRNGRATIIPANGHFKLQNLAPGDYKVYAWDDSSQVPYADADWMRRYAGPVSDVSVASGQSAQVKLTLQNVPQ